MAWQQQHQKERGAEEMLDLEAVNAPEKKRWLENT